MYTYSRIYLVGFMGSGKTTLGVQLSKKIGFNLIDLDKYIENKYFKTVEQIFYEDGEAKFRHYENIFLREVSTFENVVVSTGGGTPCHSGNMELMRQTGFIVYLHLEADDIYMRLYNSRKNVRPLLKDLSPEDMYSFIASTLDNRIRVYNRAHLIIDGKCPDINEIVEHIK